MAVVLAFRLAIVLAPIGYRIVNGPAPTNLFLAKQFTEDLLASLRDPTKSDEELSSAVTTSTGSLHSVATYTGSFELRRLIMRWSRAPVGGAIEDQAQASVHLAKITGGVIINAWDTADYEAAETAVLALWDDMKAHYTAEITLDQLRWYLSGPSWDVTPSPYNPAARVTETDVDGTDATGVQLPPQAAISVTEKTSIRKRWGRLYLPAPSSVALSTGGGYIDGTFQSDLADAFETFYNALTTADLQPVVWTRARDAYTTEKGAEIPAHEATAYSVDAVQVDNLFDVIRSRRWAAPTSREVRDVTPVS